MNTKIYILSGLGADERVFSRLHFQVPVVHLKYIPHKPRESMRDYAARMAEQITHPEPILIGLSFGGMLSQEIACLRPVERIILISSVGPGNRIPRRYRLAVQLGVVRMMSNRMLTHTNPLLNYLFGLRKGKGADLLEAFMNRQDPAYLRWGLRNIGRWKVPDHGCPTVQIHARQDRILPVGPDVQYVVPGGHFMLFTHPGPVQEVLDRILQG